MKKLIALLLAAVMTMSLLTACGGNDDNQTPSTGDQTPSTDNQTPGDDTQTPAGDSQTPAASGRVYWLNFKPESDQVLNDVAKMYTEKTGVPVKIVTAASGTYSQTLNAEMGKSEAPTIFNVGNQAGVRDWTDYAVDLTGTAIANELNTDAYNLYDDAGKLVSIGYCYECYGVIANPDLVTKAGHSMDEIKDFASLKAVVEDIHANAATLGFDAFTSCDMDDSSSWRFTGHMANLEYYYEQEGNTWTKCPATISGKYLDNFKNLYDLCINNSLTAPTDLATGGHDAGQEFKDGKAAFTVQGSWEYANYVPSVPNATMIPYYCGVSGEEKAGLNCGTENCWAVNANVSEADQKAANGFLADAAAYTADGCYVMNWATNYQPNVDEYRRGLVAALNQYNADQSDANWAQFRTAFVDGWAAQYNAVNG